eukprot:c4879_g1_i1.p1 GENE.c4879_g1_i1~~c4879_g1_i1.p1  ORF type:complete len:328 (-),score=57.57 c4879_g1_i1:230-1213(-)
MHKHCEGCVRAVCSLGCGFMQCSCGVKMHCCKVEEHQAELCPAMIVPCINAALGCPDKLERFRLAAHLTTCRASIVRVHLPSFTPQTHGKESSATDGLEQAFSNLLSKTDESNPWPSNHLDLSKKPFFVRRQTYQQYCMLVDWAAGCLPLLNPRCPFGCKFSGEFVAPARNFSLHLNNQHLLLVTQHNHNNSKQQHPDTCTLATIPADALGIIMSMIDVIDILALSQTCHALHDIALPVVEQLSSLDITWSKQRSLHWEMQKCKRVYATNTWQPVGRAVEQKIPGPFGHIGCVGELVMHANCDCHVRQQQGVLVEHGLGDNGTQVLF